MYIKSLHVQGLRCFDRADVAFPAGEKPQPDLLLPNVTLLLGNNGTGKSTILRAIALAILSPVLGASGFVPYNLVRRRERTTRSNAPRSRQIYACTGKT